MAELEGRSPTRKRERMSQETGKIGPKDPANIQKAQTYQRPSSSTNRTPSEAQTPERPQDSVEIGLQAKGLAPLEGKDTVEIAAKDMDRYIRLLQDMPDVREDEVARVEAILAEDGYGPDAIRGVVDELIKDL